MDTYPCPVCGAPATPGEGCPSCALPPDPIAAEVARLGQELAGLDDESLRLDAATSTLRNRRARVQARRGALVAAMARRLAREANRDAGTTPADGQASARRRRPGPPRQRTGAEVHPPSGAAPVRTVPPQQAQNTLLPLGGVLLATALVFFAIYVYRSSQPAGQAAILGVLTMVALTVALVLARRRLTATAETLAGVGLLMVLLDGYVAYTFELGGLGRIPVPLYAAGVFALVAWFTLIYRLVSHLRAPQFAGLLSVQPILPLAASHLGLGRVGLAAVFAIVATQNLVAIRVLSGGPLRRPRPPRLADAPPSWPRMLRELAWLLFAVSGAVSAGLGAVSLAGAQTVGGAARAAAILTFTAGVGVVAGWLSRSVTMRHLLNGAAAVAVIASAGRIAALGVSGYALVITAAVATTIVLGSALLPVKTRTGPHLGSMLGAAVVAVVVMADTAGTVASTVTAAVSPGPWRADLEGYAGQAAGGGWQMPAAAALLTMLAATAVPSRWRGTAAILGSSVVLLAMPGTGLVDWWAVPLLGIAGAAGAVATALHTLERAPVLAQMLAAGGLGLHALTTAAARPELMAAAYALVGVIGLAATAAATGWRRRLGPYAAGIGDATSGAAALTLPVAIATAAHLAGAAAPVLLPVTVLATAAVVLGAAMLQLAAAAARTGAGAGSFAAASGCMLLSLYLDSAALADRALAAVLVAAALATLLARGYGSPAPAAILADDRFWSWERSRRVDATTAAAALATAGLVMAMARLATLAAPGLGLVATTAMALVVAAGMLVLPEPWRAGPRVGVIGAGALAVTTAAGIAALEAARILVAAFPSWAVDPDSWPRNAIDWAPYGWQVPVSLLLAALALALMRGPADDASFVALALAGLAAPAALGLDWWAPIAIAGGLSAVAGIGAAVVDREAAVSVAHRRLGLAAVLALYAVAASAPRTAATAVALAGVVAIGTGIAGIGHARRAPGVVPALAITAALIAAPAAAATLAVASRADRLGVLGAALGVCGFGVFVLAAIRAAGAQWGIGPGMGVAATALAVALAAVATDAAPGRGTAQIWAAAAALVAVGAAATARIERNAAAAAVTAIGGVGEATAGASPFAGAGARARPGRRGALGIILVTALPAAALAVALSARAWGVALLAPYRTVPRVWHGYADLAVPQGAPTAAVTLLLLTAVATAAAATLGGYRYLLAAALPPLAALALVMPAALQAPRPVTGWVSLAVALGTGLGAALWPAARPSAARLLRATAGIVCALTGAAGVADGLATRAGTITVLVAVLAGASVAAALGRDPLVRIVAWVVAAGAGVALPVTAVAAAGRDVRPAAFGVLGVCAVLVAVAWLLARWPQRRREAGTVEACAALGGLVALSLTDGSAPYAAAVIAVWGTLLGGAAGRRAPAHRRWLVWSAFAAEVAASWLLLWSMQVRLLEAYTLPFAAFALVAGALERRHPPRVSSWLAYGPGLIGGMLPSLALVAAGADAPQRWVGLFFGALATSVAGSQRAVPAATACGGTVAIAVDLIELVRMLSAGSWAGAGLVGATGLLVIILGAAAERRRREARRRMP